MPRRGSREHRPGTGTATRSIEGSQSAGRQADAGDTSAFALQAPLTFGSAPRNSVTGPGYANVDLALARTIPLSGSARLEFRWEVFNALNCVNFDLPNRVFGSPNFGRIFSAKNAREMQFALRATF